MPNKRAYLIGGLGCSGKSTFAKKLAIEKGIPYFKADDVYFIVMNNLKISQDKISLLPMEQTWENPDSLGIGDLGVYGSMRECVKQAYLEFFSYNIPQEFVLEGEALFWNQHERELVMEMLNDYQKINLCLYPDYEQWLRNRTDRIKKGGFIPKFREEKEYEDLYKNYLTYMPEQVIIIKDIINTECSPTGGTNYQTDDFSDPKWDIYPFPKDMTGKTFMDISCNTGWFSKKAHKQGAKVSGIDISWQVLTKAYENEPTGCFYLSKIEDFPLKRYDYVLCSSAFHYYKNREDVIKRIADSTNFFVLELPILDSEVEDIQYNDDFMKSFCTLISEPLLLKWLKKYFKEVTKVGETIQPNGRNRPVYLCTK